MQYFFLGIVYGTVKWKSFGNDLIFADIWIYYGFSFDIAEIFRGDRRMACGSPCGSTHIDPDGMFPLRAWEDGIMISAKVIPVKVIL